MAGETSWSRTDGRAGEIRTERPWSVPLIVGGILLLAVGYVTFSLSGPEPPTFAPSPMEPAHSGAELVGPRTYTVDAGEPDRWVYFSFARGSVVTDPGPFEWDLAFRRFNIIVNGGAGFQGMGGVQDLSAVSLDSVERVPETGYEGSIAGADSTNLVLESWYDYSFFSHLLSPRNRVYAVRTADGRYATMEILGYYCPGARPGCLTFRYVYQGAGGPLLAGEGGGSVPPLAREGCDG